MVAEQPILVVSPVAPSPLGGIERYLDELLRGWRTEEILLLAPDVPLKMPAPPAPWIRIPAYGPSVLSRLICQARTLILTAFLALRKRPRLILYPQLVFAWQAALLGIPYAVVAHGVELTSGRGLGLKRWSLRKADLLIANSRDTERLLRHLGVEAPITLAYPGVHAARFQDPALTDLAGILRRRWGLEGRRVLLTVARLAALDQYKGHDVTLQALALLKDRFPDLAYLIVGDGDDRPRLEALARDLGVADRVVFAGRVSDEDLPACYTLSECFVMPSRGEGFGIAYVEAQAAGKPVIALRFGGAPEALLEDVTGALMDREDPQALSKILADWLENPARTRAMGEAGRAFVAGRFSWEAMAASIREGIRRRFDTPGTSVLYLSPVAFLGGAERFLLDLLARRDPDRLQALLICPEPGPLIARTRELGVEVRVLAMPRWALKVGRESHFANFLLQGPALGLYLAQGLRLAWTLRRRRIDLVHTNGNKAHLWGWTLRRIRNAHLVWHLHDFPSGLFGFLLKRLARGADALLPNSAAVAATLPPHPRVQVIHNGLDLTRFFPDGPARPLRSELGLPPQTALVGMVGILAPWKGHEVFLQAAREVLARRPNTVFLIVGDEAYQTHGHHGWREHLESLSRTLGIEGSVRFLGAREDIPEILRGLDLLVHASIRPEPFGRVLVEAQACGLAVVASNAGGVPEIVKDGETGILLPPGDAGPLAKAVLSLLEDPARRKALGAAGVRNAREGFDASSIAGQVFNLYAALGRPA